MLTCGLGGGLVALHVAYMKCGMFGGLILNILLSALVGYCVCVSLICISISFSSNVMLKVVLIIRHDQREIGR